VALSVSPRPTSLRGEFDCLSKLESFAEPTDERKQSNGGDHPAHVVESAANWREHQRKSDNVEAPRDSLPYLCFSILVGNHLAVGIATREVRSPAFDAALFNLVNEAHQRGGPLIKDQTHMTVLFNRPVRVMPAFISSFMTVLQYPR
jgi:hypothetical protein